MMNLEALQKRVQDIDPVQYGRSRNYSNGAVTELGPYIARGVIDTAWVADTLRESGWSFFQAQPFLQQLAWRDFFQRVWQSKGEGINQDIRQAQEAVLHHQVPEAMLHSTTGIGAIDQALDRLNDTGLMHNHLRMYTAFLNCHQARAHWFLPAQWMYAHLLDGDWGSNALSWQWVAGTFSNKRYCANQANINRFTGSGQRGTYLDVDYDRLLDQPVPAALQASVLWHLETTLPQSESPNILPDQPALVYNYYNLSPLWRQEQEANRILLLEPSVFRQYPVAAKPMAFALECAAQIPGLQIFVGEYYELKALCGASPLIHREHPLNRHYSGQEDPRNWLAPEVQGEFSSFFGFWKKAERAMRRDFQH
jgi:deoxyribodipyrimidine photo-lyase